MSITFAFYAALLIAIVTFLSGLWLIYKQTSPRFFSWSEAIVSGLFIGAGLFHLLPDAVQVLGMNSSFPLVSSAYLLCALSFMLLFSLETLVRRFNALKAGPNLFAGFLVMLALSVHSIIGGLAMGLNQHWGDALIILIAILAHKMTDSFALVINLQRADLSQKASLMMVFCFAWMTPLGMILAHYLAHQTSPLSLLHWEGLCNALAAGTFVYIGTVEGAARQLLQAKRPAWSALAWMLLGLLCMAILAIWS